MAEQTTITFTMRQFWGIFNEAIDRALSTEKWKNIEALAKELELELREGKLHIDAGQLKDLIEDAYLTLWLEIKKTLKNME